MSGAGDLNNGMRMPPPPMPGGMQMFPGGGMMNPSLGLPPFIPPGGMPMRQMPMGMQNMTMFPPPQQGQGLSGQQMSMMPPPHGMMPQYQTMQQMMPPHMQLHSNNFNHFQNVPSMMNQANSLSANQAGGQPVAILNNSSSINPMQPNQVISAQPSAATPQTTSQSAADAQWHKLFVNNIQSDIPDEFIRKLLEECGAVEKWKRQTDGKGNLNKFGIVEYKYVEGVLKCVRLLDGFDIMEEKLVVKPSQTTEKFIETWKMLKRKQFEETSKTPTDENNPDQQKYATFDEFLEKDDYAIKEKIAAHMRSIDEKVEKVRQRKREEEEKKLHPKEKDREAKRKQYQREIEKKYRDKLKEWLDHEEDTIRDQRKEREREKERERNRQKILERELSYVDDVDRQKQRTRMQERKRQRQKELEEDENDRRREQELLNPPEPKFFIPMPEELPPADFEVVSMTYEAAQSGKELVESTFRLVEETTEFPEESKMVLEEDLSEYPRSMQISKAVDKLNMISHSQFQQQKIANPHLFASANNNDEQTEAQRASVISDSAVHPSRSLQSSTITSAITQKSTKNVFGNLEEEEEEERQRALRKVELPKISMHRLNQEEQVAYQQQQFQLQQQQQQVHEQQQQQHQALQQQQAVQAQAQVRQLSEEEMKQELKAILQMIPPMNDQDYSPLFNFPLNWDLFDKSGLLQKKVKPFLLKKSMELFRQEEMSFVELIMEKIGVHQAPEKLVKRVYKVLDSDSEKFVASLWRMLIFETLKYERFHLVV